MEDDYPPDGGPRRSPEVDILKVVFHERYSEVYAIDPAAGEGRMEAVYGTLRDEPWIDFVRPEPASVEDILLAHTRSHVEHIRSMRKVWDMALLSAGGAILAAQLAYRGQPAFGLIRPPGHHASAGSAWGFCFFNNLAVALERLRAERKVKKAFVLDIDLHFCDGTVDILEVDGRTTIFNPGRSRRDAYLEEVRENLDDAGEHDILCVSAGFDEYEKDWGGNLSTEDFWQLGKMAARFSDEKCRGRRYAVFEGGYYLADLGMNVRAFLKGFEGD